MVPERDFSKHSSSVIPPPLAMQYTLYRLDACSFFTSLRTQIVLRNGRDGRDGRDGLEGPKGDKVNIY